MPIFVGEERAGEGTQKFAKFFSNLDVRENDYIAVLETSFRDNFSLQQISPSIFF
jgi:hypothetical protein